MDGLAHALAKRWIKLKSANIPGVNSQINRDQKPGHIVGNQIRGLKGQFMKLLGSYAVPSPGATLFTRSVVQV
jgi:hypothetical protein